ncbi:HK97 family phage prohead protease [Salipiger abyssi]|uniref:Phage prohead protease, HK97 family n=1 Tax=Salipiger abyssi TaxID=1250539 RepID=A0A1P8UUT4_9RHOB|nr:HK97 family phage prohead protease [Salipiger abyssi]APZ53128.1 phage prohead protease, HK97 family [Salipiger abyssi]
MDRAFSTLEIKELDDDSGTITGIASTPTPDRMDDVVLPLGAKFQLPIPLLWQHNHGDPIGHVTEATVTAKGIEVVAKVALGVTDEIDRYWRLMKAGLVRGLSIGFRGLKVAQIEGTWGVEFQEWEWLELSAVTIPAQAEASIATIKEFAAKPEQAAALVQPAPPPAASGKKAVVVKLNDPARVRAKPFVINKIHTG